MEHRFHAEQWLPFPPALVFAFFANPENLPRIMPAWQQVRIEEAFFTAPPPRPAGVPVYPGIAAGVGTEMLLSARMLPYVPARAGWRARIEEFSWNEGFCDIQLSGPFRSWRHCHRLHEANSAEGAPGTAVRDEIRYEIPRWLPEFLVRGQLEKAFRYRHLRAAELLALAARGR
ncbi:MAG: SRPBCC family protein [Acidobacteriaceae bacterium]|nr:SRPBCC family protein [Acidobacteriaceae bacterium]